MNRIRFYLIITVFFIAFNSNADTTGVFHNKIGIYEQLDKFIPNDIQLSAEDSQLVNLSSLIDKPTVLTLVYYTCPGICSPLLDGVAEVISRCDLNLGQDYQVITVSFNYNETPWLGKQKRLNYLKQITKSVDENGWHFYTADSQNVHHLCNAVGFRYIQQGKDFIHPAAIMVISPKGKIIRYLYGTYFLPFDLKMAVTEANAGRSGPTINKVLKFCFSYDVEGKKYVFNITRITAALVLVSALTFFLFLTFKKKKTDNY